MTNSGVEKYTGALRQLLDFADCIELSEITTEHLDRFSARATDHQRSRMFGLWSGSCHPSPELESIVAEIAGTR
jgi:hypothetical protein